MSVLPYLIEFRNSGNSSYNNAGLLIQIRKCYPPHSFWCIQTTGSPLRGSPSKTRKALLETQGWKASQDIHCLLLQFCVFSAVFPPPLSLSAGSICFLFMHISFANKWVSWHFYIPIWCVYHIHAFCSFLISSLYSSSTLLKIMLHILSCP